MTTTSEPARGELAQAYACCERLARAHYENFPVASWLLPPAMRAPIAAIYAFARVADDVADEGTSSSAERLDRLKWLQARLHTLEQDAGQCVRANITVVADPPTGFDVAQKAAMFTALGDTIRTYRLPLSLFDDLLDAFRQDITTDRYRDWRQVLDYCRRSANPIGRLVLRIAGYDDPRLEASSDCLCTGLQLANLWQDLAGDWARGRLYLPRDDADACGAREDDLTAGVLTPQWRSALGRVVARTRLLFADGRAVCDGVAGRLSWELRLTWLGGVRILDRIDECGGDVFGARPTLGMADAPGLLWRAVTWRRH